MTKPVDPAHIESVMKFAGYGRLDAPYWFLGVEEGIGGNSERELARLLAVRANWGVVMDSHDAHEELEDRFWARKSVSPAWRSAAKLLLMIKGETDVRASALPYVHRKLGRQSNTEGESLCGELLPLPKSAESAWPSEYASAGGYLATGKSYRLHAIPRRQAMWRSLIRDHQPNVVFLYGKKNWSYFKGILAATWNPITVGTMNAEEATVNDGKTIMYCIPHLVPYAGASDDNLKALSDRFSARAPSTCPTETPSFPT